jgi:hypothetical protein
VGDENLRGGLRELAALCSHFFLRMFKRGCGKELIVDIPRFFIIVSHYEARVNR